MPEVSVIIPAYNHARYLSQTIQSVLDQTYRDFEIIVVDDGSTDDTPAVAAAYRDHIIYLRQPNRGLSPARNAGIRAARGQYVALLDADDRWEAIFLERMVATLDSHPAAGAAYCGFRYCDASDHALNMSVCRVVPPDRFRCKLVRGGWLSACAVVARAQCYRDCGSFDERLKACEDYDMWLRMSERYQFVGVPEVLVWYRRSGDNMSDDVERMFMALMAVACKHWPDGSAAGDGLTPERRCVEQVAYRGAVVGWVAKGEFGRAGDYLRQALASYPELASDLDLWYQVGCAHQPFGDRGHFPSLNIDQAERDVRQLLDAIRNGLPGGDSTLRAAHGAALLALGTLAYGCHDLRRARCYLFGAVRHNHALVTDRRLGTVLLRSLLGKHLLDWLRHMR